MTQQVQATHVIGVRMPIPKSIEFVDNAEFDSGNGRQISGDSVQDILTHAMEDGHERALLILDVGYQFAVSIGFDGKDYPVTGDPNSDAISFQRVNANTLKATAKKGGKVTTKGTVVVSKDGKVTTVNFTDYTQANPAKGTAVYDKQ